MQTHSFQASFGDEKRTVELSAVTGGGTSIHFYVNRYSWGSFYHSPNYGWLYGGDKLETAEISILIDIVIQHFGSV